MFTYKKALYKIFVLSPKICWAGPAFRSNCMCLDSCVLRFLPLFFFHTFQLYGTTSVVHALLSIVHALFTALTITLFRKKYLKWVSWHNSHI